MKRTGLHNRTVKDIIQKGWRVTGDTNTLLTGVQYDSRQVETGNLFIAVRGGQSDGHAYITQALSRGAAAIVFESGWSGRTTAFTEYPGVVWIEVDNSRVALAQCAVGFYDHPSADIGVIGITGTNGKTTTSYIMKSILEASRCTVGLIGTINYMIGEKIFDAPHTTPEAPDFQRLLRTMADGGCSYVISEISSHALVQQRVAGTAIKAAVFTNLTRDHLDFHRTMDEYFRAKSRLFLELLEDQGCAVINADDPYGKRLAELLHADKRMQERNIRVMTFSMQSADADVVAEEIVAGFQSTRFRIRTPSGAFTVESPLLGLTNILNILAAVTVAIGFDIPVPLIQEGVKATPQVRGRFEQVIAGQPYLALIDYAHTEDALERLLENARLLLDQAAAIQPRRRTRPRGEQLFLAEDATHGRVITMFGCGGNRDRGKRPKMGEIATRLSYFTILTTDNPRFEDPKVILHDIESGITGDNYIVIHDRRAAIAMAVELASAGDIIVIAGKGHEDYQEIKGVRSHFSDREVLEEAITRSLERTHHRGQKTRRSCKAGSC